MALTITEDWIRERVQLKHNNLEDVRSLSLPGTYHEKICNLGDSLRSFSRLKSLDLSRNCIESIAGIENLKILEKLNLYYNNVGSLRELNRLRSCPQLQELDLRLNPVARNEPDYRLFLIHMLPNLRNLDDRSVRDNERKAALLHFSSDQAAELTEHPQNPPPTSVKSTNPRVEHVKSLAKPNPYAAFDQDDAAVIDLVTRQGGDLNQPRPITGSQATHPSTSDYPPAVRRHMNRAGVGLEHPPDPQFLPTMPPPSHFNQNGEENFPTVASTVAVPVENTPGMDSFAARYPNLAPTIMTTTPSDGAGTAPQGKEYGRSQVQFSEDANLRYQDEAEAYTAYKGKGHFTAHPERTASPVLQPRETESPKPSQKGSTESGDHRAVEFYDPNSEPDRTDQPTPTATQPHSPSPAPYDDTRQTKQEEIVIPGEFGVCISSVSGMVDKYWNGNRSLLRNPRFIAQLTKLLEGIRGGGNVAPPRPSSASNPSLEREVLRLREELRTARDEKAALREKLISSMSESHEVGVDMDENKMKSALIRAHRDLGIMKGRLQKAMEDNKHLQEHQGNSDHSNHVSSSQLEGLRAENERLKQEVNTLTIRLKQASHMQELANMLQESHKSLVQTNEHLLRDLEAMRQRQDNGEGHKSSAPLRPPHNGHSS